MLISDWSSDVCSSDLKTAAAAPRAALRSDDPTAQLNRFLPCQRDGKGRIGSIEQMVSLIENDPRGPVTRLPPSRRIDHDQSVIGDNEISISACPRCAFDEAFAIMRTTSIDALPASVGKSGGAIATEQGRQPSGQVATDHVAILGESRPARHQMRQCCRPAGKAAL